MVGLCCDGKELSGEVLKDVGCAHTHKSGRKSRKWSQSSDLMLSRTVMIHRLDENVSKLRLSGG